MELIYIVVLTSIATVTLAFRLPPKLPAISDISSSDCPPCIPLFCNTNLKCKGLGVTKDTCGCCDVCIKAEGEICGGPHSTGGICQKGFHCSIRHVNSHRNFLIPAINEKYGKCEHDKCSGVKCGIHQWCKAENNLPVCFCQNSCKKIYMPVCGKENGVQYNNPCEMKRYECTHQKKLGVVFGECQKCVDSKTGKVYKSGESILTKYDCEKRWCNNGRFNNVLDKECLSKKGYNCSMKSNVHGSIICDPGEYCEITKKSDNLDMFPDLGICRASLESTCYIDGKKYVAGERFIDEKCTGSCICNGYNNYDCVSLCPMEQVECPDDEISSLQKVKVSNEPTCFCSKPTCIKKSDVCRMKKIVGDCYGAIRRWYFDAYDNKCKKFIYGGCQGNANNFYSKNDCENVCVLKQDDAITNVYDQVIVASKVPRSIPSQGIPGPPPGEIGAPGSEEKNPWRWSSGGGQVLPLSDTIMTINGHIKFLGRQQRLPSKSCVVIDFKDSTRQDVSATTLKTIKYDVSGFDTQTLFTYSLSTLKPIFQGFEQFVMTANVFVGGCSEERNIAVGDYLNMKQHIVNLKKDVDTYKKDIAVEYYDIPNTENNEVRLKFIQHDEPETVEQFPDGTNPGPEMTNTTMLIKGELTLNKDIHQFKSPSCIKIKFTDTSLADVAYALLAQKVVNMTDVKFEKSIKFDLQSNKPTSKDYFRTYSMYAVVNNGWCASDDSDEWIRYGDFRNDYSHTIDLTDKNVYSVQMHLKQYEELQETTPPIDIPYTENKNIEYENRLKLFQHDEPETVEKFPDEVNLERVQQFPDGTNPGPEMTNTTMLIKGELTLNKDIHQFKSPSCIKIKFTDTSLADVAYALLAEKIFNMTEVKFEKSIKFDLQSNKPASKDYFRTYSMYAVVNNGWCASNDSDEWIRYGDFSNDYSHTIDLTDKDVYSVQMHLKQYEEFTETIFPIVTEENLLPDGPDLSNETLTVSGFIGFPHKAGRLSAESCLYISLLDITVQDASSILLETKIYSLMDYEMGLTFPYIIQTKKPMNHELWRDYTVSATLNNGWCSDEQSEEFVKKGDFITDTNFRLNISKDANTIVKNFTVICYACNESVSYNVTETPLIFPKLGDAKMKISGNVLFSSHPGLMPNLSCLYITFADVSNSNSIILSNDIVDVSQKNISGSFAYSIETFKPVDQELWRKFEISPTLNIGWCPKPQAKEWIRKGDYLSESMTIVNIKVNQSVYEKVDIVANHFIDTENESKVKLENDAIRNISNKPRSPAIGPLEEKINKCHCDDTKTYYNEGDRWQTDSCTFCSCLSGGNIACATIDCPYIECPAEVVQIPGKCCPVCMLGPKGPKSCNVETTGKYYEDGATFYPSNCEKCTCSNGEIDCRLTECPPLDCKEVDLFPSGCCPVCKTKTCYSNEKTYLEGETWKMDDCTTCECINGDPICDSNGCQPCKVTEIVKRVPGQCCPVCVKGETCMDKKTNKTYNNGESFFLPDGCTQCGCYGGSIYCASPMCNVPVCTDGDIINIKGVCCPVCSTSRICIDQTIKKTYVEGNIWQNNVCDICTCKKSGVSCHPPNYNIRECGNNVVTLAKRCKPICLMDFNTKQPGEKEP